MRWVERTDTDAIPSSPGTYALVLHCRRPRQLPVGRLGIYNLQPGWYVYVGSAFGPGGLRARCERHFRRTQRQRWHIDYLKSAVSVQGIWFSCDAAPREHQWAELLGRMPQAGKPIRRFGSSDCACPTHLFYFKSRPSFDDFRRRVLGSVPAQRSIAATVLTAQKEKGT
jgi:Uri superfamily endonuclease